MDKQEVQTMISQAKQLVEGDPKDPLTQVAFGEVLRMLLRSSLTPVSQRASVGSLPFSEFLVQVNIRNELDRVTAILYHQLRNGQNSNTRAEILQAYSSARTRQPANLSDVIAKCIRKGLVIESPEKKDGQKAWQVTQTGERHVEEKLLTR